MALIVSPIDVTQVTGITAAARTVLDDATVAAMVTTLGAAPLTLVGSPVELEFACSDETTAITSVGLKVTLLLPFAFTLTSVRFSLTTKPTVQTLTANLKYNATPGSAGTSVFTGATPLSLTTSIWTVTGSSLATTALAKGGSASVSVDQADVGGAAAGLKCTLFGTRTA